ncbi:1-deoxyxylulose-5-phosphate synthase, thiamine-requiring, FAD-requiring [Desulfosarcina cetonica]|uniref:1-deoxy-D-xylulose-5-phosphate synthase n=1 Tax=Desulfosarcina cetonica TaxID=90730 RepID=UPI0009F83998|nr:1-deoxy-D-xylulose-5-phosphate synthase [Desulfosarcina cetonica]VTR64964.1 1-deoxyxylulose-5-phosphate synthase, thiamine-requiring, FAD-requiring [Desulfosarcina cetonica]
MSQSASLLEAINSSDDLKKLKRSELADLATEIREAIVHVVSNSGGHLASSLGAVELGIALHYVFDTPRDKIIWDVGHQAYAHKLLTGRRNQFETLRRHGGLSGFTRRSESDYDPFTTGHSSTSISVGLGIACAKRLKKDPSKVVAVIGDGSMTAGLAYEGMNQTGDTHKDKDLIVILNDNEMSISPNVGAISSLLSRTFSAAKLQMMRKEFGEFLKSLPRIGENVYQFAKRSEESFKTFVTPGMLFEAFNFEYFGPIDGHNLDHLIDILKNIKTMDEPVLLHVITKKGKGYQQAEKNPVYFHGVSSFDIDTGICRKKATNVPTYTEVFGKTMVELAKTDPRIIAVTAAMPEGTGLVPFSQAYPERFFDVGIAEQHGVTFAAGMATEGFRPVVAIYSTFLQRAYDQILHDVCIENLPVVFALDRGGIVGEDGPTHHGLFDLSFLRSIPNMVMMAPKDENELRHMLATAVAHDGPIALRYPRGRGSGVDLDDTFEMLPIGKGEVLERGEDLVMIAVGSAVNEAICAAALLKENHHIRATVVNARFVKPLDHELILSLVRSIPTVLTIEENTLAGGFGSAVLELLSDKGMAHVSVKRLGVPDCFVEHGPQDVLRRKYKVDAAAIVRAAIELKESTTTIYQNGHQEATRYATGR